MKTNVDLIGDLRYNSPVTNCKYSSCCTKRKEVSKWQP